MRREAKRTDQSYSVEDLWAIPLQPTQRLIKCVPETYVGESWQITNYRCKRAWWMYWDLVEAKRLAQWALERAAKEPKAWYVRVWRWARLMWTRYLAILDESA